MADDTSPSAPSTKNLKFPDWQREFEAALLEADPQKLRAPGSGRSRHGSAVAGIGPRLRRTR